MNPIDFWHTTGFVQLLTRAWSRRGGAPGLLVRAREPAHSPRRDADRGARPTAHAIDSPVHGEHRSQGSCGASRRVACSLALLLALVAACGDSGQVRSSEKQLSSFAFLAAHNPGLAVDVTATISGGAVAAMVPFGSDVSGLVATFTATGASISIAGVAQYSGASRNDFRQTVVYRVVAEDGTTADYGVVVSVARSPAKEITALSFRAANNPGLAADVVARIDGTAVTAVVPFDTDVTALVATFTTTGASVAIAGAPQTSDASANNFATAVVYRVTAADGSTRDYVVTVVVTGSPSKEIVAFSFRAADNPGLAADVIATIADSTITARVPYGSPVATLVATFAATGPTVTIDTTAQASGVTANDFRSVVTYQVTAADGTTRLYFVLVTVAPAPKDLTALTFRRDDNPGLAADVTTTINGTMVVATVPAGTQAVLVAAFTTTGERVTVDGATQVSGVTSNDFTTPRIYSVLGADGLTKDYTVAVVQETYVKASNTGGDDEFGTSVAISADGSTLAVGAWFERSAATGIDGDQDDDSAVAAGAVYVYVRSGATWGQQAYIKASNTEEGDVFGASVALSADGSTLAVGAEFEDSAATGIDGDQADNSALSAGAAYVFVRSGTTWSQQAYVKASNAGARDQFGNSVALSADGATLAVGAVRESGSATGINGDQTSDSAFSAGAVYVFVRSGTTWSQQAYVKASNTESGDQFGDSVALSADGSTLAVGANAESSGARGINGNQNDNSQSLSGAVYVFVRSGTAWSQQAYIKASNPEAVDFFGELVALSADGSTLVVVAPDEDSAATGINGVQSDNAATDAGAVYVFVRSGAAWRQDAYVKASNTGAGDHFGSSMALSADGATFAVGAVDEDSAATGIGGDQASNAISRSGAVYVFTRDTAWAQHAYIKASNTGMNDELGNAVALTGDGATLAVAAHFESSSATGIGGDQSDNFATAAGAVYVFR